MTNSPEEAAASTTPLPSKRTFVSLEGLRGVAALSIVAFHLRTPGIIQSAYLAVDLFFVLSGFVLSYRYHAELAAGLRATRFMLMRAIRLYPLYLLGSVITFLLVLFRSAVLHRGNEDPMSLLFSLALGAFGLPSHGHLDYTLYPLNPPAWTLLAEFGVNIAFALLAPIRTTWLWAIILCSAMVLGWDSITYHNLSRGAVWGEGYSLVARVCFSFFVGVIIFRYWRDGKLPRFSVHPLALVAVMFGLFLLPKTFPFSGFVILAAVLLLLPAIVVLAIENEPGGRLAGLMRLLGRLSYPVYALHWGLLLIPAALATRLGIGAIPAGLAFMPVILVAAWLALRAYDEPVRRRLTRLILRRGRPAHAREPAGADPSRSN